MHFLFRALSLLPLPVLHALGWVLGWASFLLSGRYRRRLLAHAKQAGFSSGVALASVGEAGKLVAELPRLWLGAPVRVEWDGAELIDAAQASGAGVLFLTPHLGCFEITAQAYARRFGARHPMTVLFRPARQPWLRDLVAGARQRPGLLAAPTTLAGVKQLIKALRGGDVVGLLPDQVPPDGQGIWAPFFGRDAYTMTLSARLAQSGDTQILVSWGERLSWGRGFRVHVRPFGALDSDALVAARQINQAMEALVRECPAQYLWSYDRYKSPRPLR
ncbi:lysophospholipid acyltransferase family protein [Hydrogenophaga sp.]|uniref:lysophospholipid acyltransferase family protein n=1 Tax=Hydrogenophaga sp. TaxID=1904254 RepID=UPI0027321CAD|nr:lysophospholipid acyltransferase family protein [Hydrogenophaga sp.]MDP2015195.1 lysophospholipid acyltransferase family protein [Hydrogenophaga sp.]MDP3168340.1 lysophospholipid acyltransferase family protein [Hydrogenophaga sp.]MDP3813202.1 lysophospholipid acyltransferase family protein [Hydrogenophaga sp.]